MGIQYKQWNNEKMKSITYLHEAFEGALWNEVKILKKIFSEQLHAYLGACDQVIGFVQKH